MSDVSLDLSVLDEPLAICRLDPNSEIPRWATLSTPFSITRTDDELSIVCPEQHMPRDAKCERGWRALKLEGPFDFGSIGILVAVTGPLAEAGISILAISAYDTDYVLIRESQLQHVMSVMSARGHRVQG